MSVISFDGVRLSYVGESGAFWLYTWQTQEQQRVSALDGCMSIGDAERALQECVRFLEVTVCDEEAA